MKPPLMLSPVPSSRVRPRNDEPVRSDGSYVLYWMVAARRTTWNFGLQHAVGLASELQKPLLVFEPLGCSYPYASDRLHRFVLEGMACNLSRVRQAGTATYYPYVEAGNRAGRGLLEALASQACAVVTDEFPTFFIPRMIEAVAPRLTVRLDQVDSCGILPLRVAPEPFTTAHSFRRFLHKNVLRHLEQLPDADPLGGIDLPLLDGLPAEVASRWPATDVAAMLETPGSLDALPIDHHVEPVESVGGTEEAEQRVDSFLRYRLSRYCEYRNAPDEEAASGLSPWLHFGHVSPHQVVRAILDQEDWSPEKINEERRGSKEGWWGLSADAEAFLDQLITWREVGFNMCWHRQDHDRYESLPGWARQTLKQHAGDTRKHVYELEEFENAQTHDELWNAAQRQLVREGRMHNYLRMLWGKKILEWTASPEQALRTMIQLNDKYALDGRDPNSYSGICWVLGRYDRPWGPERPVFGKIRYMSSDNTRRKLPLEEYLHRYGR